MQFAPPGLFSAFAINAEADPDLPDGQHLRILSSGEIGMPLAPFLVWRLPLAARGEAVGHPGEYVALPALGAGERIVAVEAQVSKGTELTLILEDEYGREIGRRSAAPWRLAAPDIKRVRVQGGPASVPLRLFLAAPWLLDMFAPASAELLALPVGDDCTWYAGGVDPDAGYERVIRGAPRRLSALDRPQGPFPLIPPDAEVGRLKALAPDIDELLALLLRGDPATPPALRERVLEMPAKPSAPAQRIEQPLLATLLLSAADPGVARYLGFADAQPLPKGAFDRVSLIGVAGLFAVAPDAGIRERLGGRIAIGVVDARLPPISRTESSYIRHIITRIPGLAPLADRAAGAGLEIRALVTVAAATVPPDWLKAPRTVAGPGTWHERDDGPSTAYRQTFRFPGLPHAATLAMASSIDGARFAPRTREIRTGAASPARRRRVPLLIGRNHEGEAIASDAPVPAASGPVRYRFAAADLFGRYGKSWNIAVAPPPRPKPPAPRPLCVVERAAGIDPDAPGPLSPGSVLIRVDVPPVTQLAAGARPIAVLHLAFVGADRVIPVTSARVELRLPLPDLAPTAHGEWEVQARFEDDHGQQSEIARANVGITDARRPAPIKSAPGLIWTTAPNASEEVELHLGWPATPGQRYRAYMSDARSLGLTEPGASRAAVAFALAEAQRLRKLPAGTRSLSRLLTDVPIEAGPGGRAELRTTLPRALGQVQCVKIVPVSREGVEAHFDACDYIAVAVPDDRAPPPPYLTGRVNEDGTSVTLTIDASTMNAATLRAAEPGLFAPAPAPDARPPLVLLRRATGIVDDPLYARPLGPALPMRVSADPWSVTAEVENASLPPFVRATWWAEVRLPDERRLPPGVVAAATPGGVTGEYDAQQEDAPMRFSRRSAPFSTIPAPAAPPAAPAEADLAVTVVAASPDDLPLDTRTVTVSLAPAPTVHPEAIGTYHLLVWVAWGTEAPSLEVEQPIEDATATWTHTYPARPASLQVSVALRDPLGRIGEARQVTIGA